MCDPEEWFLVRLPSKSVYFFVEIMAKTQRTSLQNVNAFQIVRITSGSKSGLVFGSLSTPFTLASSRFLSFRILAYPCTINVKKYVIRVQIIFQLLRFPQISSTSENARPNLASGPPFGSLFELFTFDRDVLPFKT